MNEISITTITQIPDMNELREWKILTTQKDMIRSNTTIKTAAITETESQQVANTKLTIEMISLGVTVQINMEEGLLVAIEMKDTT